MAEGRVPEGKGELGPTEQGPPGPSPTVSPHPPQPANQEPQAGQCAPSGSHAGCTHTLTPSPHPHHHILTLMAETGWGQAGNIQ